MFLFVDKITEQRYHVSTIKREPPFFPFNAAKEKKLCILLLWAILINEENFFHLLHLKAKNSSSMFFCRNCYLDFFCRGTCKKRVFLLGMRMFWKYHKLSYTIRFVMEIRNAFYKLSLMDGSLMKVSLFSDYLTWCCPALPSERVLWEFMVRYVLQMHRHFSSIFSFLN